MTKSNVFASHPDDVEYALATPFLVPAEHVSVVETAASEDDPYRHQNHLLHHPSPNTNRNHNKNDNNSTLEATSPEDWSTPAAAEAEDLAFPAGVATGVLGCLMGGPLLAILLGFGAAHACRKEGALGDSARAMGQVALAARDKFRHVNQKHQIVERTQQAANDTWQKAQELDRNHRVLEQTKEFTVSTVTATTAFVQRHQIVERTVQTIQKVVGWAVDKITDSKTTTTTATVTASTVESDYRDNSPKVNA